MKKVFLFLLLFWASQNVYAQFGVSAMGGATLGYGFYSNNFSDYTNTDYDKVQAMVGVGVLYKVKIKGLFVEPNLSCVHRYYNNPLENKNFNVELYLPVGYRFKNFGLKFSAGVVGNYIIDSKLYSDVQIITNVGSFGKREIQGIDKTIGLRGGVGYEFWKFGIDLLYTEPLSQHGKLDYGSPIIQFYNRELMCRLTYYIK